MPSAAFWRLGDRLQLPDAEALELISYPEKIGPSGKRPRFRLSTRQTHLSSYLPAIEVALQALGEARDGWCAGTGQLCVVADRHVPRLQPAVRHHRRSTLSSAAF
jgi:hypothetical protein